MSDSCIGMDCLSNFARFCELKRLDSVEHATMLAGSIYKASQMHSCG